MLLTIVMYGLKNNYEPMALKYLNSCDNPMFLEKLKSFRHENEAYYATFFIENSLIRYAEQLMEEDIESYKYSIYKAINGLKNGETVFYVDLGKPDWDK